MTENAAEFLLMRSAARGNVECGIKQTIEADKPMPCYDGTGMPTWIELLDVVRSDLAREIRIASVKLESLLTSP